ncbi:NAD-dependent epimerase/dehydratase family protein [Anaeromyxobacter oryzisoli]|uniref:NAD-dependent epimerase/dehydratase family protein n=1 Tax=Anaeromyxobacter oryzisoli TaxID=2925408 RepID=UPI001F57834D|nr:NAD-dependent epimerase/dehydratase family protein [Anaeromyxobacter sp. SG63]
MDALVTGGTGFVGYHLVSALRARDARVRVLALPGEDATRVEQAGAVVCRGDVRRAETVVDAMRGADTVFHLAAVHGLWRPQQEYYDVNVRGADNVCRAVMAVGARRLVHVSSWTVYGMGLKGPVAEGAPLRPILDSYTRTKATADELVSSRVLRDRLPAVIVRPGTMFGPGDRVNYGRMADRVRARKAIIIGSGRNALPLVYVTDVVEGMILAATRERAVGETYNLSHDQPLTQEQVWSAIAEDIGAPPPRLKVPYPALYAAAVLAEQAVRADDPRRQPLVTRLGVRLFGSENRHDIEKARRELGYAPAIAIRDGLRLAARWYVEQGGRG